MPVLEYPVHMPETQDSGRSLSDWTAKARFVDPLSGPEWDELVLRHPDANFFHSSAWAKVLAKSYQHTPLYLRFSHNDTLQALLPLMEVHSHFTGRRGVCLPFSDFCAPLLFRGYEPGVVFERLAALAHERNWSHYEIRDGDWLGTSGQPSVDYYGHKLDLRRPSEDLFAGFSASVRRAIRKAEKSGLTVELCRSWEAVLEFYRLHVATRRRHGLPPQPISFFRNIFTEVIDAGLGFVIQAKLRSRPVAAAIFFRFGQTALYKFGASDPSVLHLRANNLVMWEGIRTLARSGCETLHLGRTSLHGNNLRRFKLGWGVEEETIRYLERNTTAGEWVAESDQAVGRHNAIFSKMPLALNRLAGALLYPHLD